MGYFFFLLKEKDFLENQAKLGLSCDLRGLRCISSVYSRKKRHSCPTGYPRGKNAPQTLDRRGILGDAPAQTSERGGVTTHGGVICKKHKPAQTSELGGVTT